MIHHLYHNISFCSILCDQRRLTPERKYRKNFHWGLMGPITLFLANNNQQIHVCLARSGIYLLRAHFSFRLPREPREKMIQLRLVAYHVFEKCPGSTQRGLSVFFLGMPLKFAKFTIYLPFGMRTWALKTQSSSLIEIQMGKNVSPNLWCFLKNKGEIEVAMQIDLLDRKRINTWLLNSGVLFQKWKGDPQK